MTNRKYQEPAFSRAGHEWVGGSWVPAQYEAGMTMRDYFAAKAMQAVLSSPNCTMQVEENELAAQAYKVADAMLKVRK